MPLPLPGPGRSSAAIATRKSLNAALRRQDGQVMNILHRQLQLLDQLEVYARAGRTVDVLEMAALLRGGVVRLEALELDDERTHAQEGQLIDFDARHAKRDELAAAGELLAKAGLSRERAWRP